MKEMIDDNNFNMIDTSKIDIISIPNIDVADDPIVDIIGIDWYFHVTYPMILL